MHNDNINSTRKLKLSGRIDATNRIVGQINDIQFTNNLEIWPGLNGGHTWPYGVEGVKPLSPCLWQSNREGANK